MQFLPSTAADYYSTASGAASDAFQATTGAASDMVSRMSQQQGPSFENVLSNYIEEDRYDYTGRPPGFAALESNGTLNGNSTDLLKDSLRKRNVSESSIDMLDQFMASGAPVTASSLFSVLSGEKRVSAGLEGDDRLNFLQGMKKLGFTKDQAEELLGMTDDGKTSAAWKTISARMAALGEETIDLHKSELSAILKGLDLSDATKKSITGLFGGKDEHTLGKEQLENLFAEASREMSAKDVAAKTAKANMRAALDEAMKTGKLQEQNEPIADKRGSRRADQQEEMMQDSIFRKTSAKSSSEDSGTLPVAPGKHSEDAEQAEAEAEANFQKNTEKRKDARQRTAELPDAKPEEKTVKTSTRDTTANAADRLLQRLDVSSSSEGNQNATAPAQDLNTTARNHRQEIFSQVENGFLQNMKDGNHRLTLQLDPQDLGHMTLILSVRQGEVRAIIRAENAESAVVLSEQMAELKASLEAQGLKVDSLEVQTQLRDNAFADQWNNPQEHNLMQDAKERDRMLRLSQLRRDAAQERANSNTMQPHAASGAEAGLHIIA